MRILASVLISCAIALPCSAQTILKSEPLALAAYEVAFVHDASCPAGKVLKVTGAIRGLNRKRSCVELAVISSPRASLAAAAP
jgi:predicted thioesterase